MNSPIIQLLVLAGIAVFLILRLRSVLGTREGFEKPQVTESNRSALRNRTDFEVIEGGPDLDITDHVADGSDAAKALAAMKRVDPDFGVSDFLGGARGAYEWILMAFENSDLSEVRPFLSDDVYEAFASVIEARNEQGLTVEATFVGLSDIALKDAEFDETSREAELTVKFVGEITSVVRDNGGDIAEGSPSEIKRQRDIWTFARKMGADDPNWVLVATGE